MNLLENSFWLAPRFRFDTCVEEDSILIRLDVAVRISVRVLFSIVKHLLSL